MADFLALAGVGPAARLLPTQAASQSEREVCGRGAAAHIKKRERPGRSLMKVDHRRRNTCFFRSRRRFFCRDYTPKAESRMRPTKTPSITMSSGETRMGW